MVDDLVALKDDLVVSEVLCSGSFELYLFLPVIWMCFVNLAFISRSICSQCTMMDVKLRNTQSILIHMYLCSSNFPHVN
jgi:hypothetical protein